MRENTFCITSCDGLARNAQWQLPHGVVETPMFMPVGTHATVKAVELGQLENFGYRMILANTYHLYLRPGAEVIRQLGGLHAFSAWSGNILTDSGGFQVFSLAKLRKIIADGVMFQSHIDGSRHLFTPESTVEFQALLGSDVQMVLDVCSDYTAEEKELKSALDLTIVWAKRAFKHWRKVQQTQNYRGLLLPIMQGGFSEPLRRYSSQALAELDSPALAIGGLSVGEPVAQFYEFSELSCSYLREHCGNEKLCYLMGVGTPPYLLHAIANGADIFDCVYPTRVARNGIAMTKKGELSLKQQRFQFDRTPLDENCNCPVCQKYSRAYLRHLLKGGEILASMLLTQHNLFFLNSFMKECRQAIKQKRFESYRQEFLNNYQQRSLEKQK